jgi:glutamine synthetase
MTALDETGRQGSVEGLEESVSAVRVVFSDLHGIERGKDVPIGDFDAIAERGLGFCWAVMGTDLRHTPVVGGEIGYPDMVARPDLSTLVRLPWEPDVAHCLADLERAPEGVPEPTDPRGAVRRAVAAFEAIGYSPVVGPELEFFLCERDPEAPGGIRRYVDNLSMVYTVGRQADPRGISSALLRHCADLGIGAIAVNHEYMNSQYEINIRESYALDAADRAFRLRAAVKDYAAQQGLLATFMGRPFNDQGGSGFHLHVSLERGGENACAEGDVPAPVTRWFTAGVLAHAQALMAVLNPTINAYRRILPDSLAPTHANWGLDNRGTFVRIPPERGEGARLEIRVGDGTANPYLAIAATLAAGLDGVRSELEPPDPIAGDAYTAAEDVRGAELPASLGAAMDALEADDVLCAALGKETVETFATIKRFEIERHSAHVSDWELDEYVHHL